MDGSNLIHRDDIPMELMQQIEAQFPGMKVVCAGDEPAGALPEGLLEAAESLHRKHLLLLVEGRCLDCNEQMPGFPPTDWDAWQLPDGWRYFTDENKQPMAFQCPACDAKEGEGPTLVNMKEDD